MDTLSKLGGGWFAYKYLKPVTNAIIKCQQMSVVPKDGRPDLLLSGLALFIRLGLISHVLLMPMLPSMSPPMFPLYNYTFVNYQKDMLVECSCIS